MRLGSERLSDDDFLAAIETCHYPAPEFHHADHLRLGWILLSRVPPERAIIEVAVMIQRFGKHNGKADLYHATVTRGWMQLLASHEESNFHDFLLRHSSRISANLLYEYWNKETLTGITARKEWVAPDLRPLPNVSLRVRSLSNQGNGRSGDCSLNGCTSTN